MSAAVTAGALHLDDAGLLQRGPYIDGKWVSTTANGTIDVYDPASGAHIAGVASGSREHARSAIDAAATAFPAWAARTATARGQVLRRWYDLIVEHTDDLAKIMTAEQGKPLSEARTEIAFGASFIDWFAEEGKRAYGETLPSNLAGRRLMVLRQPVGVSGAITPWNFPAAMILRKAGPALAAGCTMVLKPASETPCSALALAELAHRAGIPAGVFSVVPGPASEVGGELATNPVVRALTFTGSTEVGKILMAQCAGTIKKVSLELGGNAPLIVFDDADIGTAVAGAIASKFRNAGQTCVCANRILVQSGIYDEFVERLGVATDALSVGSGFDEGVEIGPLINQAAVEKVEAHIADATSRGARVVTGGARHPLSGTFFTPTVLADVTDEMLITSEETFGPVAPVMRFDNEVDAIRVANDTESGLAAYFFSRDVGRIWRVGEALEFGVVAVNTGSFSYEGAPFGGYKQSGIGREGSRHGLDEFLELKYFCIDGIDR